MDPSTPPVDSQTLLVIGPVLIGGLFSYLLLGIVFMQLYFYYISFPNDKLVFKVTVYTLFILDLCQTVGITSTVWHFLCSGWGRPEHLFLTDWGFAMIPLFSGVSSAGVQLFFVWRIYVLGTLQTHSTASKVFWNTMIVIIVCVSLAQSIGAIVSTARWFSINDIRKFDIIYGSAATWLAGSAIADVLIAACMITLLNTARSKGRKQYPLNSAASKRTDDLLSRLIRNSVETGAITAGAAVLELIFFLRLSNTGLHLAVALGLSKLYTNTLYASVNARAAFERDHSSSASRSGTSSHIRSDDMGTTSRGAWNRRPYVSAEVGSQNSANVIYFTRQTEIDDKNNHANDSPGDESGSIIPMVRMQKDSSDHDDFSRPRLGV
ncbi:hypothetical protein VKT23_014213 [Stygiomarasmius scandens]|uniref:DUF6534 domain-containing protein n=1 Tax=Marasmiellus scandens TaxID=2682957 RepID=A0ABR1J5P6_9AGAR